MYFKAKDYYAIGLYPIYLSFGSVFLSKVLNEGWKQYLRPLAFAIPVFIFVNMLKFSFPNKSPEHIIAHSSTYKRLGSLRWEDGKEHLVPQDYADMLGWKELAEKVDSIYVKLPHPNQTLVLCDNYGQAGAINYYTKQGIKAVSFNADYINWFNLNRQYIDLIRVKNYEEKDNELKETVPYFNSSILADSITNPYAREFKTKIFVFTGAKIDINKRIKKEIKETKEAQ